MLNIKYLWYRNLHADQKKTALSFIENKFLESWTGDVEIYRPIAEIVAKLNSIEKEAAETDKALRDILKQLGI